jgi:hypothetical protein
VCWHHWREDGTLRDRSACLTVTMEPS